MKPRLACALLVLCALPFASAGSAEAASSYGYRAKMFRNACRPPLKFLGGACVRRCPAGYRNAGGYCHFENMRR